MSAAAASVGTIRGAVALPVLVFPPLIGSYYFGWLPEGRL